MGLPVMELRTAEPLNGALAAVGNVVKVTESGDDWIRFVVPAVADTHRRLLRTLDEQGHAVLSYSAVPRSLESLYHKIVEQVE